MKTPDSLRILLLSYFLSPISYLLVCAQPAVFTYQGHLNNAGTPVNGIYDLRFTIYDAETNGVPVSVVTNAATEVSDGLFTVSLDFGASVFDGGERWLEIGAVTNGGGIFTMLTPRQRITSAPYAIRAHAAQETELAMSVVPNSVHDESVIDGSLLAADVAPGQVVKSLNALRDDIELLEGPNISLSTTPGTPSVITLSSSDDWKLSGNAGTSVGAHFVGTTDDQPLELKANNQRALRLEPTTGAPNFIGGAEDNVAADGVTGAAIGGGSHNSAGAVGDTVGGGSWNQALGGYSFVGGGEGNTASGYHAVVGGGQLNRATNSNATVAGGIQNIASGPGAFVGGGGWDGINVGGNVADGAASAISGGFGNVVHVFTYYATIGGGLSNNIRDFSDLCSIVGGYGNDIGFDSESSAIGGGWSNSIASASECATIAGGHGNDISSAAPYSVIAGGQSNSILSSHATIAGGLANAVTADFGTIAGGGSVDPANPLLGNRVFDQYGSIGGGGNNRAGSDDDDSTNTTYATVAGGGSNWATGQGTTVGGGLVNEASGYAATIAGGEWNTARGDYAIIAGGHENEIAAESDYTAIGGGEGNGVSSNTTVSCIGGGEGNTIGAFSGGSVIAGGTFNLIAGAPMIDPDANVIGGGSDNCIESNVVRSTISGGVANMIQTNASYSSIGGGSGNIIASDAYFAVIPGGTEASASHYGQHALASGAFEYGSEGSAQTSMFVLRRETNDDSWNELSLNGAIFGPERMTIPANSTWTFDILISADGIGANSAGYQIRGVIKNVGGVTSFVGTPVTTVLGEDVAAWDVMVAEDHVHNALTIYALGVNGITIRWVASVRTTEVMH